MSPSTATDSPIRDGSEREFVMPMDCPECGTTLSREETAFFRDVKPWGFILFARNVESPDQVRKLPVYVVGELTIAAAVTCVPVAWWLGVLSMPFMYVVAFAIGAAPPRHAGHESFRLHPRPQRVPR